MQHIRRLSHVNHFAINFKPRFFSLSFRSVVSRHSWNVVSVAHLLMSSHTHEIYEIRHFQYWFLYAFFVSTSFALFDVRPKIEFEVCFDILLFCGRTMTTSSLRHSIPSNNILSFRIYILRFYFFREILSSVSAHIVSSRAKHLLPLRHFSLRLQIQLDSILACKFDYLFHVVESQNLKKAKIIKRNRILSTPPQLNEFFFDEFHWRFGDVVVVIDPSGKWSVLISHTKKKNNMRSQLKSSLVDTNAALHLMWRTPFNRYQRY